jgi:hypothetical protein
MLYKICLSRRIAPNTIQIELEKIWLKRTKAQLFAAHWTGLPVNRTAIPKSHADGFSGLAHRTLGPDLAY